MVYMEWLKYNKICQDSLVNPIWLVVVVFGGGMCKVWLLTTLSITLGIGSPEIYDSLPRETHLQLFMDTVLLY